MGSIVNRRIQIEKEVKEKGNQFLNDCTASCAAGQPYWRPFRWTGVYGDLNLIPNMINISGNKEYCVLVHILIFQKKIGMLPVFTSKSLMEAGGRKYQ